ncbi:hypothetical protein GOFOIKOB_1425 [Methylobacterium tardum]|uniref:Uncharacterized protein n=1 Tax=Methylobacterium tardum TaxID=374432 RepID=A0AA37TPL9_9HYPH|nr:hypothetical protein [Methylobacterium tardum]URD34561.1 hypothetical protein M6G65_18350 [Methylobacterium tardum]GJE48396.1 hypothetical protein GOFOIKOB_1425 [Methylobacterium tardum]GLS73006.1 hypothetical protein GCM10007890_50210 [Methylobacterium tardum]
MKLKPVVALGTALALAGPLSARAAWTASEGRPLFTNEANPRGYNYAPSLITENGTTDIWWCGQGKTDVIYHRSYNAQTGFSPAQVVFQPTPGSWNRQYVCDPSVIKGSFTNPADGQHYAYAMYYSGADNLPGNNNQTGLAFSNDKVTWIGHPSPVIAPLNPVVAQTNYGAGQPASFAVGGQPGHYVFVTDLTGPQGVPGFGDLYVRHTADGVHFDAPARVPNLATDGTTINPNSDFGYDASSGEVYVITGLPGRVCAQVACKDPARNPDRETYQLGLFKMPLKALLSGKPVRWTPSGYLNSDVTGFYLNHSPGFQRDPHGSLTPFLPAITVFYAGGDPYPGTWRIATATQSVANDRAPLKRYLGPGGHWVTTGYAAPDFAPEATLGSLFLLPRPSTAKLMSCVAGTDHFLSRDEQCEGQTPLGQTGYISEAPQPGSHALFRCRAGAHDHFVSRDKSCEGQTNEGLLGYALD